MYNVLSQALLCTMHLSGNFDTVIKNTKLVHITYIIFVLFFVNLNFTISISLCCQILFEITMFTGYSVFLYIAYKVPDYWTFLPLGLSIFFWVLHSSYSAPMKEHPPLIKKHFYFQFAQTKNFWT